MRTALCLSLVVLTLGASCRRASPLPPPDPLQAPPDVAAPPPEAVKTASGLATRVLRPGTGKEHPEPQDLVEVHYVGWKPDGTRFDAALDTTAQFAVGSVIRGWSEALQLMTAGEKRRLWVPAGLAYGDQPGQRAPAGPLVFDLELLRVLKRPRPLPAPADIKAPPPNARHAPSGIVYEVLVPGQGNRHPRPEDTVEFEYTGWTPDGTMIDSSVTRGQPTTVRAGGLGRGWTIVLTQLTPGEKARFWMPAPLAGWAGPATTVVYDVELRAIR